jgi:hypothetical protein
MRGAVSVCEQDAAILLPSARRAGTSDDLAGPVGVAFPVVLWRL